MNRREFLETGAAVVGGMLVAPVFARAGSLSTDASATWYRRPLRILQTVLREIDARDYDPAAVIAFLQEAACNTLVVNAGGIVDFFPNPLPLANPSPFLGPRDILREISHAGRAAGIRVIARVDFRGVEERLYRQHPDWFGVDLDGQPLTLDYTRPKLFASCYTSVYRNEHAEEFIRHVLGHYPVDGIWHNSVHVGGVCYCPRCRESYRSFAGTEPPDPRRAPAPELERYMQWKAGAANRHVARMRRAVKAFGEDKSYAAEVFGSMYESGGAIWSGIDLYSARDYFDFLVATGFISENTEELKYDDLHHAATLVRFMKSMTPDKEAVILYGDNGTSQRYIMDPPVETRIWLWEALSAGGRFWDCWFMGMDPPAAPDHRAALNSEPVYTFVRDHEDLLAHHIPVANVGIFYSRATRQYYRNPSPEGDDFGGAIKGTEIALLEAHIPYDFIPDDQLSAERLKRYALVVLPNVRCLSSGEMTLLRAYVHGGGRLLATFATSLQDETGRTRADLGLADVFGCSSTGRIVDTRKDTYQHIADPRHPLVAPESPGTELLVTYGRTLLCRAAADASVICTHVPTVPNQPPEKAWVESWTTDWATIIDHPFGKGRCIYFANQPDQNTYDMGQHDERVVLQRAIRYLAGEALPIAECSAPETVHVGLTRSLARPDEYLITFVNLTSGPNRPVRRVLPVFDFSTRIRLVGRVHSRVLRTQGKCTVASDGRIVTIHCERLDDCCVVWMKAEA